MAEKREDGTHKRRSLAGRARDEEDPDWKLWFLEVERRRKELSKPVFITAAYDKDGSEHIVSRNASSPLSLKKIIGKLGKVDGPSLNFDLVSIRNMWKEVVSPDIAGESEVAAFKNGILTITVFSTSLLQEMRQFFKEAIVKDLRENWSAKVPLVDVKFVVGKRRGRNA